MQKKTYSLVVVQHTRKEKIDSVATYEVTLKDPLKGSDPAFRLKITSTSPLLFDEFPKGEDIHIRFVPNPQRKLTMRAE